MPALPPYLPAKEAKFTNWLANFSTLISAGPSAYGLLPSDAATISTLNSTWSASYGPITSKATKTAGAVQKKNIAKVIVTAQIRTYSQNIANNPGVTAGNKVALGLNPKTSTPAPITAPATFPTLALQQLTPLSAVLRYRDSGDVSVKAKPYGVAQCRLFGMAAATPVSDQSTLPLFATPTKSPFVLNLNPADVGMRFYAAARWATETGLVGPWSPIMNFFVTN